MRQMMYKIGEEVVSTYAEALALGKPYEIETVFVNFDMQSDKEIKEHEDYLARRRTKISEKYNLRWGIKDVCSLV